MRGNGEDQRQQQHAHRDIGHDRLEDVGHRDLRRRDALHRHQQEPVRRQQQAELHADQEQHAEPDRVDAEPLHHRHEDRQRDQHHADLVDEHAEEDQQQHHAGNDREGGQALAEDRRRRGRSVAPEKLRICEKVVAPRMMNRIIARDRDRAAQRRDQRRQRERAIGERQRHRRDGAERGGLGRRRDAGRHRADDDAEDRHQRQDVEHEQPVARPAGEPLDRRRRRERRFIFARSDDVADEGDAEDQPGHDAADQQLRDRDAGQAAEQHGQRRRRDQHVDGADRHDRPGRHRRVIAARQHHRQHQRAEHRGRRDGRAGDRREHRAGDDRDDREPARHLRDQPLDAVDHLEGEAGVEQHLAHQDEERDRRQREIRAPRRRCCAPSARAPARRRETARRRRG